MNEACAQNASKSYVWDRALLLRFPEQGLASKHRNASSRKAENEFSREADANGRFDALGKRASKSERPDVERKRSRQVVSLHA